MAIEDRFDALLALGREREVVAELEPLVAAEPLRERFRAQLMLGLYRSGRQADALDAYRQARRHLSEELGLEPSPELQHLQRAILRHDRTLARPRGGSPAPGGARRLRRSRPRVASPPAPGSGRHRRRGIAAATALLAVAVLATVALLERSASRPADSTSLPPRSLAAIDGDSGAIDGRLRLAGEPAAVTADADRVWVAEGRERALVKIDPARMGVVRRGGRSPACPG
jgi:hypothetical protein